MKNRPPVTHLLVIGFVLAALAAGAFWYTSASDPVEDLPQDAAQGEAVPFTEETCEAEGGRWNADDETCDDLAGATVKVSAFFPKDAGDGMPDCSIVHAVSRTTQTAYLGIGDEPVYMAALEETLKGPQAGESGYFTSIPAGAGFVNLEYKEGTVYVEFGDAFDGVAGSCRVTSIRAQIESTLRQFPEVKRVVIMADRDPETVLQP